MALTRNTPLHCVDIDDNNESNGDWSEGVAWLIGGHVKDDEDEEKSGDNFGADR